MITFLSASTKLENLIQRYSYILLSQKLTNLISIIFAQIKFIDISKFLRILDVPTPSIKF